MSSEGLHEDPRQLPASTIDRHRAIASIMEELEAVDWYDQRVAATGDAELAAVLAHNRDEEKEHAAMTLEWLRRRDPVLDRHLRTYLFTTGSILEIEDAAEHGGGGGEGAAPGGATDGEVVADTRSASTTPRPDGSLGIGSLRRTDRAS